LLPAKNPAFLQKSNKSRQMLDILPDPANRVTLTALAQNPTNGRWRTEAMRSHSAPRLLFVAKGQGRITVAGLTSGYGPNNLIFIPARTMYGFEVGPSVFAQMLAIPASMVEDWPDEPVHLRLRDVIAQKELAGIFDALEREIISDKSGQARAAQHHVGLLSVFFERQVANHPTDPATDRSRTASARLVAAFSDLVERDFRKHKGIADYAADLGVTPTHLTRCCRSTSGRSALRLLNDRVLYEARLLLRETSTPVQDIAQSLGYTSAAYFTRSFQQATGQTPTGFRRSGVAVQRL
jgi:AraC family transcriptional activator of pobA